MNQLGNCHWNENDDGWGWWWWQAVAEAARMAVAGGLGYFLTRRLLLATSRASQPSSQTDGQEQRGFRFCFFNFAGSLQAVTDYSNLLDMECQSGAISRDNVPSRPVISNLNSLLADIYVRYIALKKEDFQRHYSVFDEVFRTLNQKMKAVDSYYERYGSNVQCAGSHYDRLRINKPDKFDMDIVIGVPVDMNKDHYNPEESDIVIEQKSPGFVQLRASIQYQNFLICAEQHIPVRQWLGDRKYILCNKFTDWFKRVGNRGLDRFPKSAVNGLPVCEVDGVEYTIRKTSSGPGWNVIIESADGFKLDVTLVPALKFPEDRWLGEAYREIPEDCRREYWMVVPEPNKAGQMTHDELLRSWRVALQDQEKQLLNDTYHLRQIIQLLKKLRDAQGMKGISSYCIKTLFFWEVLEKKNFDRTFWQRNNIAMLFKHMLQKFYEALEKHNNIPYFWNKKHNLIENLNDDLVNEYKYKLRSLLKVLQNDNPCNYKLVAEYLLTSEQFEEYERFL